MPPPPLQFDIDQDWREQAGFQRDKSGKIRKVRSAHLFLLEDTEATHSCLATVAKHLSSIAFSNVVQRKAYM